MKAPVRVAVTGAAGQIGYALLFRIASGEMLGKDQPVILQLLEVPVEGPQKALKGVMMELDDCAFPLLAGMEAHSDPMTAFRTPITPSSWAPVRAAPAWSALTCCRPTRPSSRHRARRTQRCRQPQRESPGGGQSGQHQCLHRTEVGPGSAGERTSRRCSRLDHNRALSQLAAKTGTKVADIKKLVVWGNHSPTMYPDVRFATANGAALKDKIDDAWNNDVFIPTVGKRGAAIIEARGVSSAASAANAAIDHMRDWALGTNGEWVTMGIPSDGSYGIPEGIRYGVAVTCANGEYTRVTGLEIDAASRARMDKDAEGADRRARRDCAFARLAEQDDNGGALRRLLGTRRRRFRLVAGGRKGMPPFFTRRRRAACHFAAAPFASPSSRAARPTVSWACKTESD